MPSRRDSLYVPSSNEHQPFLTALEQQQSLTSHRQVFLQESHHRRESFDGSRRSSIARRRPSFNKSLHQLVSQPTESIDGNATETAHESQGLDRFRKDAGSRFKQTIFIFGDLSKISPESACNSRCVYAINSLGDSPIHLITKIVASSNGCIALLNDRNHIHVIGNTSAIGLSSSHTKIGSGYRDVAILYSTLIMLNVNGSVHIQSQSAPARPFFNKVPVSRISSSDRHAALVSETGALYTFGCSQGGALGHGREWPDEPEPRLVESLQDQKVRSASCGTMFTVIIVDEYHAGSDDTLVIVYSCGLGCNGRLGHGDFDSRWVPTVIDSLTDPVAAISCGDSHCLALTPSGIVYSWGGNSHGQLGYGSPDSAIPKTVALEDIRVAAISAGSTHSALLASTGTIFMFGSNRLGQLAIDRRRILGFSNIPVATTELANVDPERIFCGANFTVVTAHEQYSTRISDETNTDDQSRRRLSANESSFSKP